MNSNSPSSWSTAITKALATLVIAAVVLYVVEHVFVTALPGLLIILALAGVYRMAVGMSRRDGW